jgi:hypothetical protein
MVVKWLNRFLPYEYLLERPWVFKSWVMGDISLDHLPVLLKIEKRGPKTFFPFKFNHCGREL